MPPLLPFSSSSSPCCAACMHLNAKCEPGCPYAPYFPANQMDGFLAVHEVYGMEILKELLQSTRKPAQRRKVAEDLVGDAQHLIRPIHLMLSRIDSLLFQRLLLEEMIRRSSEENAKLRARVVGDKYDAPLLDEETTNPELMQWPNEQQQQEEFGPFNAGYNHQSVADATNAESSEQGMLRASEQKQEDVGVSNTGGNEAAWGYSDDANSSKAYRQLVQMPMYSPDVYDFAFPEQPPQYDGNRYISD